MLWLLLVIVAMAGAASEIRSARLQSLFFSRVARLLTYRVEPGIGGGPGSPTDGPYDERLGYLRLRGRVRRLEARGFRVVTETHWSPWLRWMAALGMSPVYDEKTRAGLRIEDRSGETLFLRRYPRHTWTDFGSIPPLVVRTLLFLENRELLSSGSSLRNPAVEWDRLAYAVAAQTLPFRSERHRPGGSTLATQIEKYRHSSEGRTHSVAEKLRQMGAAALRAYRTGPDTSTVRRRIVLDYLNSVPLAAVPGEGEVQGIGDGLWAWYGTDLATANAWLTGLPRTTDRAVRGRIFKQVVSLLVAQRRPSEYMLRNRETLRRMTNRTLELLAHAHVISTALRDDARSAELEFLTRPPESSVPVVAVRKESTALRAELLELLGVERFYDLDRIDLEVRTTLDGPTQDGVNRALRRFRDPDGAKEAGLLGPRLLNRGDPSKVIYSFLLFERGAISNRVRVDLDTFDGPFQVNHGSKLDLGSTAKLRTLVHYLDLVARLHARWAPLPPEGLAAIRLHPADRIGAFVRRRMREHPGGSLDSLLDAALERTYSADPNERFFTGGGWHRFSNFNSRDDRRVVSVREAFRRSVNLPFVRLMRDIVDHVLYGREGVARPLPDESPRRYRQRLLARFADYEGSTFLERFFERHRTRDPAERFDLLVRQARVTPRRLAFLLRSVSPEAGSDALSVLLERYLPERRLDAATTRRLYAAADPSQLDSVDRGWLARVHPLELWLVGYLKGHPEAELRTVLAASRRERQQAYRWLFRTRNQRARELRVRQVLERDAFRAIHRDWARWGYPFEQLVPSLATAIGSSADRPEALAELVGILVNGGVRLPALRISELRFAQHTPYENVLRAEPHPRRRVLAPEVAAAVRRALFDVVDRGTGRRVAGAFVGPGGMPLAVGGKTGTGDVRFERFSAKGRVIDSRVVSRTASFVFLVGERYFGVITAYVPGREASHYSFTSALSVQALRALAPKLMPLFQARSPRAAAGRAAPGELAEGKHARMRHLPRGAPARS